MTAKNSIKPLLILFIIVVFLLGTVKVFTTFLDKPLNAESVDINLKQKDRSEYAGFLLEIKLKDSSKYIKSIEFSRGKDCAILNIYQTSLPFKTYHGDKQSHASVDIDLLKLEVNSICLAGSSDWVWHQDSV